MATPLALADTSLFVALEHDRPLLRSLSKALESEPLPVDDGVAIAWAELRARLRELGRRLAVNDSWIAATAIAHGLPLVTQDRDYTDVPGLTVVAL